MAKCYGFSPFGFEFLGQGFGAVILPDNCMIDRFSALPVPGHNGFTLIGNADGIDRARFFDGLGDVVQ